ncbi:hypothetical protein BY996DRAFT_6419300 [Phakopsora pachyrhizi]|nr:hypothetical protein BY996DRAFT_6419300 [Phakopsora pachyrhizi]
MDTDDEQLYSSEFENEPPKKSSKKKHQQQHSCQPGSGVVYEEQQIPPSSLLKDTGHDASITKTFSSTLSNTEASENLGENPLELLLLSLEVRLEPHPEFESYIQELALDYISIMLHQLFVSPEVESYTRGTDSDSQVIGNVQSGNPEQPIPRLIELAKMTVISQKKASETDFSLVIPPTMEQVKQEMRNNNSFDSFKNNKVTSEEE